MANAYHDVSGRFPQYDGLSFQVHELLDTRMTKAQDPPHGGSSVDLKLAGDNGGFVQTYMDARGSPVEVHPTDVMGYHTDKHLPVYDHLSEKFCVCDRWFSSVPGSTFPNRLYSMAGRAAGAREKRQSADLPSAVVCPSPRWRAGSDVGDVRARRDSDPLGGRQRLPVQASAR
jgi:hypothetical protein